MSEEKELRVGVVGPSGNSCCLTKAMFERCYQELLTKLPPNCTLVSGGSSFIDHLAVVAFLEGKVGKLHLHLPVKWIEAKYKENRPGQLLNNLHQKFSKIVGRNSLDELEEAMAKSKVTVGDGFFNRNTALIKDCDQLIVYTVDGHARHGTLDSLLKWQKREDQEKVPEADIISISKLSSC
jgi:hypothetical protein